MKEVKEIAWEDFKGRIPVTDVDGIDLKPEYLAEAENVEFQNGYIVNSGSITEQTLPTTVQTLISDNYDLVDNTFFEHSKVGFVDIYILWKTDNLRIVVNNQIMNLNPVGGGNAAITFLEAPKKVNYNLVNDQLKINLNCRARYTNIDPAKDVILNLTLIYFPEDRVYYETNIAIDSADVEFFEESDIVASPNPIFTKDMVGGQFVIGGDAEYQFIVIEYIDEYTIRVNELFVQNSVDITDFNVTIQQVLKYSAGWYCFPRWLGWSYQNVQLAGTLLFNIDESFEIPVIDSRITLSGFLRVQTGTPIGGWHLFIAGFQSPESTVFTFNARISTYKPQLFRFYLKGHVKVYKQVAGGNVSFLGEFIKNSYATPVELNINEESDNEVLLYIVHVPDSYIVDEGMMVGVWSDCYIDNVKVEMNVLEEPFCIVIAKYADGQRGMIKTHPLSRIDDFQIKKTEIDWRVVAYEIYVKEIGKADVLTMKHEIPVETGWQDLGNGYINKLPLVVIDEVKTLNFNYGLGEVRVDNQKEIYSEVEYRRRIYFVKNDFRIYQSHIAGNGLVQPDSFPFNEDNGYGFIETGRNSINTALAITPTNDLLIYHKEGFYVYRIQGMGISLNRELRLLNNTAGIQTPYSLNKTIDGSPSFAGLFWINKEGVWYYAGGVSQPPVNLITQTHRNFWLKFTPINYENPVTFFIPSRNEYWIKINAADVFLVYEASYNQFRTYKFNTYVEKFIGIKNGKILFKSLNKIYEFQYEVSNTSLPGMVSTHWRDEGIKYRFNKIMQEVFVEFTKESSASREVTVFVYADKYLVGFYVIKSNELIARRLLPLFIRFQKVKIILWLPSLEVRVSRFGVTYTEDGEGNLGFNSDKELSPFDAGGYGSNYGGSYGSGGW